MSTERAVLDCLRDGSDLRYDPATSCMRTAKRILVPVDFSEGSLAALQYARYLAGALGASLVEVLHIWLPPANPPGDASINSLEDVPNSLEACAHLLGGDDHLPEIAALRALEGVEVQTRIELGNVGERIAQRAFDEGFDLVVMGTHGRTGLRRWLMGSVADHVVRHSSAPVLTLRGVPRGP